MDDAKKVNWLLFAYLAVFPFGQLARFEITVSSYKIPLLIPDLILGLFVLLFVIGKFKMPKIWPRAFGFLLLVLFSSLVANFVFQTPAYEVLVGFLYWLRLFANFIFFVAVSNQVGSTKSFSATIFKSLIAISVFVGVFGWIQYLVYPDLRSLYEWGWDDHLYRLAGTFLDPGFTSILLVFGFLASLSSFLRNHKRKYIYIAVCLFLFVTVLFTYSRAGYLALAVGTTFLFIQKSRFKSVVFVVVLLIALLLLPRPEGEGVRLERVASIVKRLSNYGQTVEIIKKSPLFGVGYNNLCFAKKYFYPESYFGSHSCGGSDSSLLFILATGGVLGSSAFIHLLYKSRLAKSSLYGSTFLATGIALLTHSLFVNSMFYPWVLGWMMALAALSVRE
ncbi:hypothetical protein A2125_00735 [Candidatus Woesebacteria bacterium GWB1_43_5]|uniref:O-antigen ligase-related domain-containing protein n=1 Tax=Candidatus Woesebacteria bacterium GWB1_43_5 TaxID=1802474 RepID=A0A1F7WT63_9BACT|nr:MAG: hypothetical protein A2125_00735 [Candidatus Woesebacteria bacterium GWB1_43_5]